MNYMTTIIREVTEAKDVPYLTFHHLFYYILRYCSAVCVLSTAKILRIKDAFRVKIIFIFIHLYNFVIVS